MSDEVRNMSYQRNLVQENYTINELIREKSGVKTASLDVDFAQFTLDWMPALTTTAKVFVMNHLMHSLRKYNLLWHFPTPKKRAEKMAIKELIDSKILFRTETPAMYLINPLKLWRGTVFSSIECTKELLRNDKPNPSMVRDLKPSSKYLLKNSSEQYNSLADNGITPNLLGEPDSPYSD